MRLLFTISLGLVIVSGSAQSHYFGYKAGFSLTDTWGNDDFGGSKKLQSGFALGFTYDYLSGKKFSFGLELLAERRGVELVDPIVPEPLKHSGTAGMYSVYGYTMHLYYDYLSLPIKVGYCGDNKFFGSYFIGAIPALLGLSSKKALISYADHSKRTFTGSSSPFSSGNSYSIFDVATFIDVGCGYRISKKLILQTSLRPQYSFTTLWVEGIHSRNYGVTLSVGIKYNFSSKKD